MTFPDPVLPVRGSRAESVRSKVCAAFNRSSVSPVTVMASVALLLPEAFPAVSRTVNGPGAAYTCVGLCSVEVPPSPKSQAQEVAPPVEASANCTTELTAGFGVDAVKDAAGAVTAAIPARIERPRTASALKSMGNGVMTPRIGRAGGPVGSRPARANGSETGRASVCEEDAGNDAVVADAWNVPATDARNDVGRRTVPWKEAFGKSHGRYSRAARSA